MYYAGIDVVSSHVTINKCTGPMFISASRPVTWAEHAARSYAKVKLITRSTVNITFSDIFLMIFNMFNGCLLLRAAQQDLESVGQNRAMSHKN